MEGVLGWLSLLKIPPVRVARDLRAVGDRFVAFLARTAAGEAIGVTTVMEAFAIYAGGNYGSPPTRAPPGADREVLPDPGVRPHQPQVEAQAHLSDMSPGRSQSAASGMLPLAFSSVPHSRIEH